MSGALDFLRHILATSVHPRMKGWEVRHIVGDRIFDASWPAPEKRSRT